MDESAFLAARRGRHTQFVTGIVAMAGPGQSRALLLDVVPGHTKNAVERWFSDCEPARRAAIGTASLDPVRGHASALLTSLPGAVRVLDAFTSSSSPRPRWTRSAGAGSRNSSGDMGTPRPALPGLPGPARGLHTHTLRSWARAELAVTVGEPSGQLLQVFQVSHELQRLYAHARDSRDAARRLHRTLVRSADSTAPELHRLARTLDLLMTLAELPQLCSPKVPT